MAPTVRNIRDELAEAISFAIRIKSHYLRQAKLTEAQCRIDSSVIADHVFLANFIVMHGAPSGGTYSLGAELDRAQEHRLACELMRQLECEVVDLKDNATWCHLRHYVDKRFR